MMQQPFEPLAKARQLLQQLGFQRLDGEQRNQAHHRADAQTDALVVRPVEHIVVELVLFIPQAGTVGDHAAHGVGNAQEVLEELGGDVFVHMIVLRELQGDAHQIERIHGHPAGAVGLVDVTAGGQPRAPVEHADVVQSEESSLEDVAAVGVLLVDPPGEVQHQLVEHAFEEFQIALAAVCLAVDLIDAPRRPAVHGGVDVAERPLVSGNLAVGPHVPFAGQQNELVLGELGIDERKRNTVKGEVPRGVPGVLPFVG